MIAVEPSFLVFVAGMWEQPNSTQVYGGSKLADENEDVTLSITGGAGGITLNRYQDTAATEAGRAARAGTLDRGAPKGIELFRNAKAWLADPTTVDPLGDIGERATINYFLSGDVSFDFDHDPYVLTASANDQLTVTRETLEGGEKYPMTLDFSVGLATLHAFPDAQ